MYARLWRTDEDSERWRNKSRGVILGMLHEEKLKQWEYFTGNCPLWGTDGESELDFETEVVKDDDIPF